MKHWNVDLRSIVEELYRKDGVWDSLPQEEREKLENREQVFQRRTCYGDPIDEKVFCIRNESKSE